MAWINRQMPKCDEIFFDHIGYFVENLETAGLQMELLGFQVSDINIQYNQNEVGELHPTGTSNKLAKLNIGFIELLAATSESALAEQLQSMLLRYQGLHVIALTNDDMVRTAARLEEAGIEMQEAVHMRRKVTVRDEETLMVFTILRVKPGTYPEGRLQILTNHTPENFWLPNDTNHQNRADKLTDLLICVEDLERVIARYEVFFDKESVIMSELCTLDLDRGRFHFISPKQAAKVLPKFSPPTLPYICGQGISSRSIKGTKSYFNKVGIIPAYENDKLFCISPIDALGAYLLFHDKFVDAPWTLMTNR